MKKTLTILSLLAIAAIAPNQATAAQLEGGEKHTIKRLIGNCGGLHGRELNRCKARKERYKGFSRFRTQEANEEIQQSIETRRAEARAKRIQLQKERRMKMRQRGDFVTTSNQTKRAQGTLSTYRNTQKECGYLRSHRQREMCLKTSQKDLWHRLRSSKHTTNRTRRRTGEPTGADTE